MIDADLGGWVIKKRIARPSQGKSGGFRTIILFKSEARAFFVYGFAKNDLGNIGQDELVAFKKLATIMFVYDDAEIKEPVRAGVLIEVTHGKTIS